MRGRMIVRRGSAQRLLRNVTARSSDRVLHEKRAAPGLALEADAEIRRLVGILGADAGLADDGFEALEVGDDLAHVCEVDPCERLRS